MRTTSTLSLMAVAFALFCSSSMPVHAESILQEALKSETSLFDPKGPEPDINAIPTVKRLVQNGAVLYYLGSRSQIHGWFVVKDGKIQILYLSPDTKTIMLGALMDEEGRSVTREQVQYLLKNKPIVRDLLSGANRDLEAINQAGKTGGVASVSADEGQQNIKEDKDIPSVSLTPGEQLIQDMKAAASVKFGQHETAKLYMMASPSCPVCKTTWRELRNSVAEGRVEVHLIPVYNQVGDQEVNQAAKLLTSDDPLKAWNSFVDGDPSLLSGQPDSVAIKAVTSNLKLVSKWNIQGYPYLVYRAKDGRIKIVQGRPERMAAVLLDMLR